MRMGTESGDKTTAQPKAAFRTATGPHGLEINTDRGKYGYVKDGENTFRQIFRLFKLQSNAAKSEVEDACATLALFSNNRVCVGADH